MKCLTFNYGIVWIIQEITRQRMTNVLHVHANLMSASGFKTAANMGEAVRLAYEKTLSGGVVLMSPGAPSYNQYKNFEERGKDYKKWIKELS